VETTESQAASEATSTSLASKTPTRLVIRVRIPQAPPPTTARRRLSRRALVLILAVAAALTLIWIGIELFRSDPASAPVIGEGPARAASQSPAPVPTRTEATRITSEELSPKPAPSIAERQSASIASGEPESTKPRSAASEVPEQSNAPPSSMNEVLPDPPQSALDTIRGTVRVSIRVIVDKDGTVIAAAADDPGPSRYFERLSLEAAKKWTFTPADTQAQRVMLVRFNFTREGTTARAHPLQ
jgi:TonB family protein